MSCPTCDHTMHTLGRSDVGMLRWCPRCGTAMASGIAHAPMLVEGCREFETFIKEPGKRAGEIIEWRSLGIAESINKPEDRPQ